LLTPFDVVNEILPHIKALIVWNLSNRGFSQRQIARAMFVSQALISKYLAKEPQYYVNKLKSLGFDEPELSSVVEIVTTYIRDGRLNDASFYLTTFLLSKLRDGKLCRIHRSLTHGLLNCSICQQLIFEVADELVQKVKYVLEKLELIPNIQVLVPEIGMNLVEARPNAKTVFEVVGIPGRIVKVFNTIRAVSQPTYGGSRFLSMILLEVMRKFPQVRSAANIKYLESVEKQLRKLNSNIVTIGPYESRSLDIVIKLISKELNSIKTPPDAIIDLGPPGFEHLIYIFAEDSIKLLEKLKLLATSIKD
jgi:predicted fused transcriptional regulator/phosphomethylpyrimidine kinase/predicted transcriptional regulator